MEIKSIFNLHSFVTAILLIFLVWVVQTVRKNMKQIKLTKLLHSVSVSQGELLQFNNLPREKQVFILTKLNTFLNSNCDNEEIKFLEKIYTRLLGKDWEKLMLTRQNSESKKKISKGVRFSEEVEYRN